jgi:archaellum biogenesis protein FlaJ (TadC family)
MEMADRIEEILMEAYAYGIHKEVFNVVEQIKDEHRYDLSRAYEIAFQQTMSRYEQSDSED